MANEVFNQSTLKKEEVGVWSRGKVCSLKQKEKMFFCPRSTDAGAKNSLVGIPYLLSYFQDRGCGGYLLAGIAPRARGEWNQPPLIHGERPLSGVSMTL